MMNVLNGGVHADNNVDFQEFMVMPVGAASYREALRWGVETYHALKSLLHERGLSTAVGDEGGFAPDLASNEDAVRLLVEAIERAGYTPGDDIAIALDPATSELYRDGRYELTGEGRTLQPGELADLWVGWLDRYPIVSIEDGMAEDDWDGWRALTDAARQPRAARRRRPVRHEHRAARDGDRPRRGELGPHQGQPDRHADRDARHGRAGDAVELHERDVAPIGETEDATIADLAVATNCGQIKTGAPARSDRIAKYNQLLRIEEDLGESASYPGRSTLAPRAIT